MKSNLAKQLVQRFRWYKELFEEGAWTSAVTRLAEIYHCASNLPKNEQALWIARIRDEGLSDDAIKEVEAGIRKKIQRLRKIVSTGNRWTAEEILLVVQKRIELEMLFAFLSDEFPAETMASLDEIDQSIVTLSNSKEHGRHFAWARRKMRQNWGLPIRSKWLRETKGAREFAD